MWRLYPRRGLQLARQGKAFHFLLSSRKFAVENSEDLRSVGTCPKIDLFPILIKRDGGHSHYLCILGGSPVIIYVDLLHYEVWIKLGVAFEEGFNFLAFIAPIGHESDKKRFSTFGSFNSIFVL